MGVCTAMWLAFGFGGLGIRVAYDLAFGAVVFFDHLHVWVFGKAVLTD